MKSNNSNRFRNGYHEDVISLGNRYSDDEIEKLAIEFNEYGWVYLGKILTSSEISDLKSIMDQRRNDDRVIANPEYDYTRGVSSMRMFEYHIGFLNLLNKEPVISFVEKILGNDCHLIAQNALFSGKGQGIIRWHIDDQLFFPFKLNGIKNIPCYSLNVMISLTNVDKIEYGPTQVVSKSHCSGLYPSEENDNPCFDSNHPTTIYANAGDVYILNSQLWHRGSQNN